MKIEVIKLAGSEASYSVDWPKGFDSEMWETLRTREFGNATVHLNRCVIQGQTFFLVRIVGDPAAAADYSPAQWFEFLGGEIGSQLGFWIQLPGNPRTLSEDRQLLLNLEIRRIQMVLARVVAGETSE